MRVAFAGTSAFAATALEALVAAGHIVPLVLTQPDRPAGRGMRLAASAISKTAARLGLATLKPQTLRDGGAQQAIRDAGADVLVVAAYGLLLPRELLAIPPRGCINIHASLLPRWRGAAPIQRAILAGDERTGISIMQMDAGLDTGPVLAAEPVGIQASDTAGTLTSSLASVGARLVVDALARLDSLRPTPQDPALATVAPKVAKHEAAIDWSAPAVEIDRRVRAFNPAPGAEAKLAGETIKIWEAVMSPLSGAPGTVLACEGNRLVVACGEGSLDLRQIQKPGGRPMSSGDFVRGARLMKGKVFA